MSVKRNKRAAQIALNRKLQLERFLYNDIAAIFRDIAAKAGGAFFNVGQYEDDIERAILAHYRRVFKEFGDDYREEHGLKLTEIQAAMFAANTEEVFEARAKRQARIITATNRKQLAHIKKTAEEQMPALLKINPNLSFYRHVSDLYGATLLRRVETISIYETQWSAEFSRANEVAFLTSNKGVQTKARKRDSNFKRWDAVGDDRMRDWHADADSTVIPIDEPFEVNGEELMYPGDESLGATASNIINCRCTVSYEIDEESLTAVEEAPVKERSRNKMKTVRKESNRATQDDIDKLVAHFQKFDEWANGKLDLLQDQESKSLLLGYMTDMATLVNDVLYRFDEKNPSNPVTKSYIEMLHEKMRSVRAMDWTRQVSLPPLRTPSRNYVWESEYRKTPVDVGTLPTGFETDHEKAIARAQAEIDEVFKGKKAEQTGFNLRDRLFTKLEAEDAKVSRVYADRVNDGIKKKFEIVTQALPSDPDARRKYIDSKEEAIKTKVKYVVDEVVSTMHPNLYNLKMDDIVVEASEHTLVASADPATNMIKLSFSRDDQINEFAHEFGHHIEFDNPRILRRFQDWRDKRIKAALDKGEEWYWDDNNNCYLIKAGFYNDYISKIYANGYTEALSMGIESLFDPYKNDSILNKDPEHLALVWATLRGY